MNLSQGAIYMASIFTSRFYSCVIMAVIALSACSKAASESPEKAASAPQQTAAVTQDASRIVQYRTVRIDGVNIFYREAGRTEAPVVLLLHGFPASSFMYRD